MVIMESSFLPISNLTTKTMYINNDADKFANLRHEVVGGSDRRVNSERESGAEGFIIPVEDLEGFAVNPSHGQHLGE